MTNFRSLVAPQGLLRSLSKNLLWTMKGCVMQAVVNDVVFLFFLFWIQGGSGGVERILAMVLLKQLQQL